MPVIIFTETPKYEVVYSTWCDICGCLVTNPEEWRNHEHNQQEKR